MQMSLLFNPTNHSPPRSQPPSNHSAPANNALQNQHQAEQETKEVRYHREQERHEPRGILSAPFSLSVYSTTLASSKATANYFGRNLLIRQVWLAHNDMETEVDGGEEGGGGD